MVAEIAIMREGAKIGTARGFRRTMTDAERPIWRRLRRRALDGAKFRRQHPIGPYVADFACLEHHLVIEIDGSQHALQTETGATRTEFFQKHGFRLLRFWNNDALSNIDGVLTAIMEALASPHPAASPPPSPASGRGLDGAAGLPLLLAGEGRGEGNAANESSGGA